MLAKAIVYGVPMITLLYLSALFAIVPVRGEAAVRQRNPILDVTCTAFSLSLSTILLVSITVTFWNAVWLFFALCIGVRVSLKEQCLREGRKAHTAPRKRWTGKDLSNPAFRLSAASIKKAGGDRTRRSRRPCCCARITPKSERLTTSRLCLPWSSGAQPAIIGKRAKPAMTLKMLRYI